jgi:small subunit ribosomal protein S2e
LAGISDVYTCTRGRTRTLGNFARAVFAAIGNTYAFMTPDMWAESPLNATPFQEFSDHLARAQTRMVRN